MLWGSKHISLSDTTCTWFCRKVGKMSVQVVVKQKQRSCCNMVFGSKLLIISCCCTNAVSRLSSAPCSKTWMLIFLIFCSKMWTCVLLCKTSLQLCKIMHGIALMPMKFEGGRITSYSVSKVVLFPKFLASKKPELWLESFQSPCTSQNLNQMLYSERMNHSTLGVSYNCC